MSEQISRIYMLQDAMQQAGISVCVIPHSDVHQSEYISMHDGVIEWLTGFSGSAGTLVVTQTSSYLWTDGRYTIQARRQAGCTISIFIEGTDDVVDYVTWLGNNLLATDIIGIDASFFSYKDFLAIEAMRKKKNVGIQTNFQPIPLLWKDRPLLPTNSIIILNDCFAGEDVHSKVHRVRREMSLLHADYYIVSALDEVAWLLNCRGSDIAYNPVFRSFSLLTANECVVFLNQEAVSEDVYRYFAQYAIQVLPYSDIKEYVSGLRNATVLFDGSKLNADIVHELDASTKILNKVSPIAKLKAIKNSIEIDGCQQAMRKDGVVWVRLWRWLENELAQQHILTEGQVASKLTELKEQQEFFVSESFKSIVAYEKNAAICHYSITENAVLANKGLLLIDTGTHYLDGTTDTTRVIVLGELSPLQKKEITLVLKGHIALAQAVFIKGTKGHQLDFLARQYLKAEGSDYAHGTGHGIGHCLNVHEGYASISPKIVDVALQAGMLLSNEPGVYKENEYGARIENVMVVENEEEDAESRFLQFRTLTVCPIDICAIDVQWLTADEIAWLTAYQKQVLEELFPFLTDEEKDWLQQKIA
ncbi:MAG: aminopeptidase P family protein [Paludibacteraceae bacterium]|nr:aminopeptidase P family protein [Paludibacteraceae bacterium]